MSTSTSSSSSSSSPSSPSPSSPHEEMGGRDTAGGVSLGVGTGADVGVGAGDGSGAASTHYDVGDVPSTSRRRRRFANRIWPALFIEAMAIQVAIDASRSFGRLAAAPALYNLFQVCSTWRAVSRSDLLWENLTRRIWNRRYRLHDTWNWRDEFIYRHRTANNFRVHRCLHTAIPIPPSDNNVERFTCLRLALSDDFLAAGFSNGMVQLYIPNSMQHLVTYHPEQRDRLGRFPSAVTGIVLSETHLVFASLDGDVHVVVLNPVVDTPRRAHPGDVVNDGALVDFAGCNRWWVGLYAGAPGRAFHVWNRATEQVVFIGGTLTDPESLMGWHLLHQLSNYVGRVRVTGQETAIACTRGRVIEFDLEDQGLVFGQEEFARGLTVGCFDAGNVSVLLVDGRGLASVRHVLRLNDEEVCQFMVRGVDPDGCLGCLNGGYAIFYIAAGGFIRIWNAENGQNLYTIRERIGQVSALIADERYVVAASSSDSTIHMWDFGA